MRYKIPRYIEYKPKIVGPATFSQLVYLGVAAFIIFTLYVIMGMSSFFVLLTVLIASGGIAFAFLQISGEPIPEYIKKMFFFSFSSKRYVWKRKESPMKVSVPQRTKAEEKKDDKQKKKSLKFRKGGRLQNITDHLGPF